MYGRSTQLFVHYVHGRPNTINRAMRAWQALMQTFEQDAHLMLLFLKNLERVALYDRDKHAKTATLLFKVELGADCIDDVSRLCTRDKMTKLLIISTMRLLEYL